MLEMIKKGMKNKMENAVKPFCELYTLSTAGASGCVMSF